MLLKIPDMRVSFNAGAGQAGELYVMKSGFQGVRTRWIRVFMTSETASAALR
jgi:hypothetical protein